MELLALKVHLVENNSGTVDGGPAFRGSPTSLALAPSASLTLELQFGRLRWSEESIATPRWNFSTLDLPDLSLRKS